MQQALIETEWEVRVVETVERITTYTVMAKDEDEAQDRAEARDVETPLTEKGEAHVERDVLEVRPV
jgi:hypothetical protein